MIIVDCYESVKDVANQETVEELLEKYYQATKDEWIEI